MRFQENVPLAELTNFKIGGPARYFFLAQSAEDVQSAVREANEQKLKIFILGSGTNLLIGDAGFDGLVLKPSISTLEATGNDIRAGSGVLVPDLLNFAIARKLSGFEWAGGLPGTVGGAVRGNAGCFGGETKDNVRVVKSFDIEQMKVIERTREECGFGYRTSVFRHNDGKEIVLEATFSLASGDPEKIRAAIHEKIDFRTARHPLELPNIGSIFKNIPLSQIIADGTQIHADHIRVNLRENPRQSALLPIKEDPFPVIPAAYLISEAGMKGETRGGASVSPKHPNFIVNTGGALSADVEALIARVKAAVHKKFGVTLEEEIQRV